MERPLEQPTKRQAYQAEDRDRAWPHRAAKRSYAVAGGILTAWLSSESVRTAKLKEVLPPTPPPT